MTRILRYILRHDTGMAPCVDDGLVSLATCKPRIRASARPSDWVAGFRPGPHDPGLLVWAGRVAGSLDVGEYERRHRGRSDAVYRAKAGGGFRRLRRDYHPGEDDLRRDTCWPVLVFDPAATWYFGRASQMLPEELLHLAARGRPDLVNGVREGDVAALQAWLSGLKPPGIHAAPREPSARKPRRC